MSLEEIGYIKDANIIASVTNVNEERDKFFIELDIDGKGDDDYHVSSKYRIAPFPNNKKERWAYFIIGNAGGGKSYLTNEIIKNYRISHGYNRVIIFTSKNNVDGNDILTTNKFNKVVKIYDENFLLNEVELSTFKNSLLIFDDVENLGMRTLEVENFNTGKFNKKKIDVTLKITNLKNLILNEGRKWNISMVATSHLALNKHHTDTVIRECDSIIFFKNTSMTHLDTILNKKLSIDKDVYKKIYDIIQYYNKSRHIKHGFVGYDKVNRLIMTQRHIELI